MLSPSTARRDRGAKSRIYAAAGVREVIDLGTEQRRVIGKGERAASAAVPGFGVDVTALFAA